MFQALTRFETRKHGQIHLHLIFFNLIVFVLMAEATDGFDPLKELREELGKVITNQTTRLSRQDTVIANMFD